MKKTDAKTAVGSKGLRESLDPSTLLKALLEASATAMLLADDERRYVEVNEAACQLLGYDREELLSLQIENICAPDLADKAPEMFDEFKQAGTLSGPFTVVTSSGDQVAIHFSATANVLPGVHLSVFTDQKLVGEGLESSESSPEDERDGSSDLPALSARERQILTMLALGESNQTIAASLHLAPETVRNYTRSARLKLGAKSRSHAIALAVSTHQIDLGQLPDLD